MKSPRPSLLAVLLRAAADWATPATPSASARTVRRRRARQRLKDRAALADFFRERQQAVCAEAEALRKLVDELVAERGQHTFRLDALNWHVEDLARRNVELIGLCADHQHAAEYWKRFVESERASEPEFPRKVQLN